MENLEKQQKVLEYLMWARKVTGGKQSLNHSAFDFVYRQRDYYSENYSGYISGYLVGKN